MIKKMTYEKLLSHIRALPLLPLSALIFYASVFLLWHAGLVPSPLAIIAFLEGLYASYGLIGLFIASFLEGIVYFGLYFPGSFVVVLAVILSDGSFQGLLLVSLVVALALWVTSIINYVLGRRIVLEKGGEDVRLGRQALLSRGLVLSALHPNALAFYFFNSGIKRRNTYQLLLVPVVMIPYGLFLALLFYQLKEPLKKALDNPYIMISALLFWFLTSLILQRVRRPAQSG